MFCTNCGKQIQGEGLLCPECAAAQAGQAGAAPQLAQDDYAAYPGYQGYQSAQPYQGYQQDYSGYQPSQQGYQQPYQAPQQPYQAPQQPYQAPQQPYQGYQQPYQAPAAGYHPGYAPTQESSIPEPGFTLGTPVEGQKKKKGGAGKTILLIVLALALVGGVVALALNWDKLFNKVKIPEDPVEYVAFLEEPQMRAMADQFSDAYGKWLDSGTAGSAIKGNLKFYLGDEILNLLRQQLAASNMDMELDWLRNIGISFQTNSAPDMSGAQLDLGLSLGETKLVDINTALDLKSLVLYLAVPQLQSQVLKMDINAILTQNGQKLPADMDQILGMSQQLMADLPSQEAVAKLTDSLVDIILRYLTDAQKSTEEIKVGDAEQELTVLTVTVTQEQLVQLAKEVVTLVKNDEAVRQAVQAYLNYMEKMEKISGESLQIPAMADFEKAMDDALADLEEALADCEEGNYLLLHSYVDGATVLGRRMEVYTDGEKDTGAGEFYYCSLAKDGVTYFEADLAELTIDGEGTATEEGLISGEYIFAADGTQLFTLELEDVSGATGYGAYILAPEPALLEEMDLDSTLSTFASGCSIRVDLREDGGKVALMVGKTVLLSLDGSLAVGEAGEIALPSDAVDASNQMELMNWLMKVRFETVVDSLKQAGIPSQLQELLDGLVQMWNAQTGSLPS